MLWKLIASFSFFIILFVQDVYVEESTTLEQASADQAENSEQPTNPQETEQPELENTEKPEGETGENQEADQTGHPEGTTNGESSEGAEQSEKPQESNEVEASEGNTESPVAEQTTQSNDTSVEGDGSSGDGDTPQLGDAAINSTETDATVNDLSAETEAINGTNFSAEETNATDISGTTITSGTFQETEDEGDNDANVIPDETTNSEQEGEFTVTGTGTGTGNGTETETETETDTETEEELQVTETVEEGESTEETESTSSELVPSEDYELTDETQTTVTDDSGDAGSEDDGDINSEWENQGVISTYTYDETLGEYAAKVALYLRQNLINLFGYLMYQPKVDITREVFFYLHQLKLGLLANKVDIFEVIHVLPKLYGKDLNDQFTLILEQMEKIADAKYCHIKCTAGQLKQRQCLVDMSMAVGHLKYNPILTGILETAEDIENLQSLSKALKKTKSEKNGWIPMVFSKHLIRIIAEINKQVALTDQILGYLIPFYPWPVGEFIVEQSVQMMTKALEDSRESLVNYGVDLRKIWAPTPIRTMKKLMIEIYESKCERAEKVSSIALLRTLNNQLTFPDYRNTFQGVYAEINRLWELLDIVDHENYPPEIVMAREHLKLYLDKVVFYLNYPRFIAYKYAKVEETLIAFLDYIVQETPYLHTPLKLSLSALKTYLLFYTGPRKITYDLFLTLIDGLMAADLNNEILDYMLEVKVFVLDEATEIKRAIKQHPVMKCTDLIPCYFQILAILKKVPYFQDKMHLMMIDECLLRRYLNDQELPPERQGAYEGTPLDDLLDIIDFQSYTIEVVMAAQQIKQYIGDSQSNLNVPVTVAHCTKQETLLHKLESLVANNPKFPSNIAKCINSVMYALKFKLASFEHVTVDLLNLIFKAWSSPFIDNKLHGELNRVQTLMISNQRDIDLKLSNMDPHECSSLVECYNGVIEHLNIIDPRLTLNTRTEVSPELFGLNVGKLAPMNTRTLIKIIDAVQDEDDENSPLEAVKSYLADFQVDIDSVIKDVDCNHKQVLGCFSMLLDKMRFSEYQSHVEINIIQYALMPTVCDSSRCRWVPYEEMGTVIINPLFRYMLYLLEHYSADEVKSFHLQMDIFQILDYLNADDVGDILPNFKLTSDMDNIEKISQFLELLHSSKLVARPVQLSVKNVYEFITNNELPESMNVGNFLYLERQFAKQTNSSAVHFELNDIIDDIHEHAGEISDVLKKLYVDCFTLQKCLTKIREQITTDAYDSNVIKPILRLLQPESCKNDKQICPWISKGLSGKGFVKKHVYPAIQELLKDPKQPLITKIVWKIIGEKAEKHENLITETIEESDIPGEGIEKLKMFIGKALQYDMPRDLKKYLNEMRAHMNNPLNSFVLDVMILNGVLNYMSRNTLDGVILTDIKETQKLALINQANINKDIRIVKMNCDKLQKCVQDIFDGLSDKGLSGKNFIKLLLQLLLAKKCSIDDCAWRAINTQITPTIFTKKLVDLLEELLENDENPFVVRLDVEEILNYFENADDLIENIQEILVNNDADHVSEDDKELLLEILAGLAQKAPASVDVSMNSVVDYVKHNKLKSYLLTTNLKRMIEGFISLAESKEIAKIMENGSLYLKGHDEETAEFLDESPINCRTQDSCVKTLYAACQKKEGNEIAQVIMSVLRPEQCRLKICPWIKPIAGASINQLANMINKELTDLQHEKHGTLHIKLDAQAFKKVIKACPQCLLKIFGGSTRSAATYKNLRLLLQLIDVGILRKYELEIVKKDIEGFLTVSALPTVLDHPVLLVFAEILKKLSKSEEVKKEIEEQKVKAIYEKKGVRAILLVCVVDCADVKLCTSSLLACVQSEPTVNNPEAIIIERMVNPKSCNKEVCQWIPDIESHEDLMEKFEEIKDDVKEKIEDVNVPIIIRVMLNVFLDFLEFTKVEKYLTKITATNPDKLDALLSLIVKDDKEALGYIARIALKVKNYLKTKKIPKYLTYEDLQAIVKWIAGHIEDHPDVQEYLKVALNLISRKQVEIDALLKNCTVECVALKPCLTTVSECLQPPTTVAAFWILHVIFPDPCDHDICPWMPDKVPNLGEHLPTEKPTTILLDQALILYVQRKKEQFIILDLKKQKPITMLEAYSYLADSTLRRVTVLYAKQKKLILDFIFLKGMKQAGSAGKLEVDFAKTKSITICQQFKNGAFRPLKFDLAKAETRKALMDLATQQESRGRYKNKQTILLKDAALGRHRLYIDVMDPTTMRTILEASIDDVMPEGYQAVFFWPNGSPDLPWRSTIIEDGSGIEAYLLNLPGMDYAGSETPVVITFDGFITMDFDINNKEVQDGIESSLESFSAILDASEHTKFMFYFPFPFRRRMIPFPVDLEDSDVIDLLIRAEKKYWTGHSNESTITIKLEDRSIPLKFDFFSDVVTYILQGGPEDENEGVPDVNWVAFSVTNMRRIILDLRHEKVRKTLLSKFKKISVNRKLLVITLKDDNGVSHPIVIDPNNELVVRILASLSANTLPPTKAFLYNVGEKNIIVCVVETNDGNIGAIFEDVESVRNRLSLYEQAANSGDEDTVLLPFSKPLSLTRRAVAKIVKESPIEQDLPPIFLIGAMNDTGELVLPLSVNGVIHIVTVDSTNDAVIKILLKHNNLDVVGPSITFVVVDTHEKMHTITLPSDDEGLLETLKGVAIAIETQIRSEGLMVIVTVDDDLNVKSFILNLDAPKVLDQLQKMSNDVDEDSTSKGVFFYTNTQGVVVPIILDNSDYDMKLLEGLEQYTPTEMQPIRIPNIDRKTPLIGCMIKISDKEKMSIVLDAMDNVVMRGLQQISKASKGKGTAIKVTDRKGSRHLIHIDGEQKGVRKKLHVMVQRLNPFHTPTMPISIDGSYTVTMKINENGDVVRKTVNTMDINDMKELRAQHESLDDTAPVMLVVNPKGIGEELRVDVPKQEDASPLQGRDLPSNFNLVVMHPNAKKPAIILNLENMDTADRFEALIEDGGDADAPYILYIDYSGKVVKHHINLMDDDLMQELWQLMQETYKPKRESYLIMPESNKPHIVFTVPNDRGEVVAIILDISKQFVKDQLVAMWGYSTDEEGIEIKLPQNNKETLVIHINPKIKDTVPKLIELMNKHTGKIDMPLVIGSSNNGPIIKIPTVESEKVYLINCNVSDPMVAAKLQKDHGRRIGSKRGTVTLMYLDPRKKLQSIMLDLNDAGVIRSLKRICKKTTAVLNLSGTVVVTTEDPLGNKQTSVVDITNPLVQEHLSQMGHIIVSPDEIDENSNVITVPAVDENQIPSEIHLGLDNVEVYELLDKLTELSVGDYTTEQIIGGRQLPYTVVFSVTGPIVIDQTNAGLVQQILKELNDPDNPNAVKVVFVTDQGVQTVYLDLTDGEKMSKLKDIIDKHFEHQVVAPLLQQQGRLLKIPCLDLQQRPIILMLDLTKSNVVRAFKEIDKQCDKNGKFTLKVSIKSEGKLVGVFAVDTTNLKMCEMLKQTANDYQYDPPYGSLVIVDLPLKNFPVIILDLANRQVVRGLNKISERVRPKDATHYILHLDRRKGTGIIYKINVQNKQLVKMLLPLAQLTQVPIYPRRVLSPYDNNPILVSTLKMGNGEVKHIVLPATNKKVNKALREFSSVTRKERPVEVRTQPIGKPTQKYVIDVANDTVIEELMMLTRTLNGVTDAFLNIPLQNPRLHKKIVISLENEEGSGDSYMVATNDIQQYKKLKTAEAKIPKKKPSLVLYFVGQHGFSNAVRADLDKIFTMEETKPLKIINPEHILIISVPDENDRPSWLLLNLQNKQVVNALLAINTATQPTRPYTAVTIKVRGKYKAIRLNLLDSNTVQRLKSISEHTDKPTAPNVVISPFGPKPLFVMTVEGKNGSAQPIVIDLNKDKAIDFLDKASDPDNANGYSLQIPGKKGKTITIFVDPYDKRCRKALEEAHKLTPAAEAPIPGKIEEKIVIPLPSNRFIVNVDLDSTNTKAIKALLDLSLKKGDDIPDVYLQLYLPDPRGILALCILDITREDVINEVIKIVTHTSPPGDKPPISAGPNGVYLVVLAMRLPDGMIQVTIDPNNPKVIDLLKKVHKDNVNADSLTVMKIPLSNGNILRVYIDIYDPKLREMLDKITDLAKVMLSPAVVIPPGGPNPIFSVIMKVNGKSLLIAIDLNNKQMIEEIQKLPVNSDKDTIRIDFVWPEDEQPDTVFIDISNPKVIAAIQPYKQNITVYPIPSKTKEVLLVREADGTTWEINLNNQEVVDRIIAISAKPTTPDVKVWTIEFITPQECRVIVYINFNNSNIRPQIEGTAVVTAQIWNVIGTSTTPHITVLVANVVVYPPHGVYPLIMVEITQLGFVTWDINQDNVFNVLIQVTGNSCPSKKCIIIEVPDGTGEGIIIYIDVSNKKVFAALIQVPVHEHIAFVTIKDHMLPILYVIYNGKVYELDLNKPEVIKVLVQISSQTPNAYKIIITLPLSVVIVYLELPSVEANLGTFITNTTVPSVTGLQTCETIWTTRSPIVTGSTASMGVVTETTSGTEMSSPEVTEESWETMTWPSEDTESTNDIWTWTPAIVTTETEEPDTDETTEYTETSEEEFTWPAFTTEWYTMETYSEETEYETETTDYEYTDTSDTWATLPSESTYEYSTYETSYETDSAYTDETDYTESEYTYSTYETSYETDSAYTDETDYTESAYTYSTYETSYETDSAYTDETDYTESAYTYSTYETSYETDSAYTDETDYTESAYTYSTYETSYETDSAYTEETDYTGSAYTYSTYETSYETDSAYTDETDYTESGYTYSTYETSYETDSAYTEETDYTESAYTYSTYETSYETDSAYTDETDYTESAYTYSTYETSYETDSAYTYSTYETSYETDSRYTDTEDYTDSGYTDSTDYKETTYAYSTYETSYETYEYTGRTSDDILGGGINITSSGSATMGIGTGATATPNAYGSTDNTESTYTYGTYETSYDTEPTYADTTDYSESTDTYSTYETSYETDSAYTDETDYTESAYTYSTYETSYETDSAYTDETDYTESAYTYSTYETSYETDSAYTDETDYTESAYTYSTYETSYETDSAYTDETDDTESAYTYSTYETSYETDSAYTEETDYMESGYTYSTYETSYETDSAYTDETDYTESGYTYSTYETSYETDSAYTDETDYTESADTYSTYETSYETESAYTGSTDYIESSYTFSTYETSASTDEGIIFSTIATEPEVESTSGWSVSSPEGSLSSLTSLSSKPPFTTEQTFPTPNNTWQLNVTITTQIPGGSSIYWVAINVTNYVTFEMYTYIFDVSLKVVITKLTRYVASLTIAQRIITIVIPLPGGQFTLHINPYNQHTFELFTYLTIISTGRKPIFVAIITPHVWWSFTITDSYNNVLTFKVDVANKLVVLKLQLLSSWYVPAPNKLGIIIKGRLLDGTTIQIIIDPSCPVTIENLHIIMKISIDGIDRPLKPLPPPDPSQYQQLIEIVIQLPARKKIKLIIDVSKQEIWEKFLGLNGQYRPGATNYIIKITKDRKKYTIKINLFDRQTLLTLIELDKLSGAHNLSKEVIDQLLGLIRLHSYVTIVISDFKENLPITLDVTDENVYKLLKKVESKNSKYAMVIDFIDSKNRTRKLKLNVNDRQVIQILLAVGIPTTNPRITPKVRLLTFIFAHIADSYVAVLLDMANRGTVIFFIELVRKHAAKFGKQLSYVEARDDNGQYVTIAVDFSYRPFLSELARKSQTSQRHRITSDDHPFVVFCLPVGKKYIVLKARLSFNALEKLRRMEPRTGVIIDVVDEQERIYIDPRDKKLVAKLMAVPGISFIQSSNPKPRMIIYTVEDNIVSPIYLDLRDTNTINRLIKMHNRYSSNNGKFPLTLIRFIAPDKHTEYLLLNIRHQGAISVLSKLSIHIGDHTFAKQRMEKIATVSIPRRNRDPLNINLNLADPYVLGELRRLSNNQIPNKNVQTLNFVDAYGSPLMLNLDFTEPNVIRKLTKLHYTL